MTKPGYIVVKQPQHPDDNGALLNCQRARVTELAIGQRELDDEPDSLRARMAYFANIARRPDRYPELADRPRRALAGDALYQWVARRAGCAAWEVQAWWVGI